MRVLLVEDDVPLGEAIRTGLRRAGFAVEWVGDGKAAQLAQSAEPFEAIVLDLGLPGTDGLAVLRAWRAAGERAPVLILTARDAIDDRLAGLDGGGDDYVVKPVDLDELAARLRALVRRAHGRAAPLLVVGDLEIDPASRSVRWRGAPTMLSVREFDLLHVLAIDAGRVLTREQLDSRLYGWGEEIESNALEVHVHHLRRKLDPALIRTVRGVGYVMPKHDAR